ncbi:nitroreductase family protein [Halopseudomonas pachastrellae]|uniref:nitroreductase family protein n=1 Tax=Halopseudomonas pachastrellae TaxID=254161 RepID=UPI003D7E1617
MDALTALHQRTSVTRLTGPAPSAAQQQVLFRAALRAPDHAYLRPWRFLAVEGAGLNALGEVFARAALADTPDLSADALARFQGLPLRAPLVIVAISCHQEHPKVPAIEQDLACGAAVNNMLLAAHAMGLGAVWRTGALAYHPLVHEELGLADNEQILAFLYVGQPVGEPKTPPELDVTRYFSAWPAT